MVQRYYERKDGQIPPKMKLWADPAEYVEADLQAIIDAREPLLALDDASLALVAPIQGGTVDDLRAAWQQDVDTAHDILDFFDYEKTTINLSVADGAWFTPEAVEMVCGEEVGNEAALMIDGNNTTYWQHDADEAHQVDLRLRNYSKKMTGLRIRRQTNERSALNNLDIYVASSLGGLDNPEQLAISGVTLSVDNDWNEIVFPSPARGKYIRLSGFGSAHAGNEVRIREIEARVIVHEYQ